MQRRRIPDHKQCEYDIIEYFYADINGVNCDHFALKKDGKLWFVFHTGYMIIVQESMKGSPVLRAYEALRHHELIIFCINHFNLIGDIKQHIKNMVVNKYRLC